MARHINQAGLNIIKECESFMSYKYKVQGKGNWTIGWGHEFEKGEFFDGPITREKAEELLRKDVVEAEESVEHLTKGVKLNDNQFSALVSFTFNIGEGQLATSTLLKKLKAGDFSAAMVELLKWHHDEGKDAGGLIKRRTMEKNLFETPC